VVLEVLRIIFGLLLIFVLPGTMLIKAMFPRPGELDEEYNGLYVLTLGMATSVCLTILVGFVLGSLPVRDSGKGWFDAPFITASLVALTLVFFAIGWWRGAFPWLGLLDKRLARFPLPAEAPRGTKRHDELLAEIDELTRDRDRLKREVKDLLRRERAHGKKMAEHYREQRKKVEKELDDVRERLERAKEKQSKLIYEARQKVDARQKSRELRRERREKGREKRRTALEARPSPEMEETEPEEEADEVGSTEEE
jgi:hypothetical protein